MGLFTGCDPVYRRVMAAISELPQAVEALLWPYSLRFENPQG
jgi:hypothetical protein